MLQLGGFAQCLELSGALVKSSIVGGAAAGSSEGQIAQKDAAQMAQLAVLR